MPYDACRGGLLYSRLVNHVRAALDGWDHVCRSLGNPPVTMDRWEYVRSYVRCNPRTYTITTSSLDIGHVMGGCCLEAAYEELMGG